MHKRRMATVLVAVVAAVIGLAGPALATDGRHKFQNQNTGRCLDYTEGVVVVGSCGPVIVTSQYWQTHRWRDNTHQLLNESRGQCLDDSFEFGLRLYPCNQSPYQSWFIHKWRDGTAEIKNQATGRCVDDSIEFAVRTFPCNTSTYQSWWGWW